MKMKSYKYYVSLIAFLLVMLQSVSAQDLNSIQREFCQKNKPTFEKIDSWIKAQKGKKPTLAVPPAVELDCSECGTENHKDINENKIDDYTKQLGKPESDYITQLLEIEHQLPLTIGDPPDYNNMSQDVVNCFKQMSAVKIEDDVKALMNRIFDDKVIAAYNKFSGEIKYGWALINTIEYYTRYYVRVLGYDHSVSGGVAGFEEKKDQGYINMQKADELVENLYKRNYTFYQDQLYKQYHYNIYPNVLPVAKTYLLVGGHDQKLENNIYDYINESIAFMHFKLKLNFEETGPNWHYKIKGETMVRCRLVPDTSSYTWCYVFEPMDGKGLNMKMDNISITLPGATAEYIGPNEADNPYIIRVNLCNGSPVLHLVFTTFGIKGDMILRADGKETTVPAPMQPMGYFIPDLATAQKKLAEQLNLLNDFKAHKSEYEAAMKEWMAHRNDPDFKNTSQGKKDIALTMQFEHQSGLKTPLLNGYTGQTTSKETKIADQYKADQYKIMREKIKAMTEKSKNDPHYPGQQKDMQEILDMQKALASNTTATTATGNNKLMTFDMPLQFSKQAVNYENSAVLGGTIHYHVTVTLEETPDKKDNIQPPK